MRVLPTRKLLFEAQNIYAFQNNIFETCNIIHGIADRRFSDEDVSNLRKQFKTFNSATDITESKEFLYYLAKLIMNSSGVYNIFGDYNEVFELLVSHLSVLKVDAFRDNPYYRNIKFPEVKQGIFNLEYEIYSPFEFFIQDIANRVSPYKDLPLISGIPELACFIEEFRYPLICQGGTVWMTVTPNEVNTMHKEIGRASGDVLTLGLGLGYYAYMVSLKGSVNSVTIIEREQSVIDLFNEYILPQFENRHKIKIIKADAIQYLSELEDGLFDYCFADIWENAKNFNVYFKVKECGKRFKKMKIDYWIENAFLDYMTGFVWSDFMESLVKRCGVSVDLPSADSFHSQIIKYVHKLFANIEVGNVFQLHQLLDIRNLNRLISNTKLKFSDFAK